MTRPDVDILILSPHLAPPAGGIQRLASDIQKAFGGYSVRVVGVSDARSTDPTVRAVLQRHGRLGGLATNLAYVAASVSELRRRPRFIQAMSWRAAVPLLVLARRTPSALYCHGAELIRTNGGTFEAKLRAAVLRRVSLVIANSQYTADIVRTTFNREPTVIHPPLSASATAPNRREPTAGLRIVSVGRLVPNKGHDRLIRTLSALRESAVDATLHIVGSGPEETALRSLISKLGLDAVVHLHGGIDDAALQDEYSKADAFALLSVPAAGEVEGFGIVFLEAAAHGLAAVAGRSGGSSEAVVDGVTGFVVNDEESARIALLALAHDPALRAKMGSAGRERAEQFRLPKFRQLLADAYADVGGPT